MDAIVEPPRALLEEREQGGPRTAARVARNRDLPDSAWIDDRVLAWNAAQNLFVCALTLYDPRPDLEAFTFPETSHAHWGIYLT